jgi:hypothetical protein
MVNILHNMFKEAAEYHAFQDTSKNFLRVLAEPKPPNITEIDIVAVHGLNPFKNTSNAISTWTSTNGKMWLEDEGFLPTQIPNARIMLFGYNSNVAFASSNAGLVHQATNLLFLLDRRRAVGHQVSKLYP